MESKKVLVFIGGVFVFFTGCLSVFGYIFRIALLYNWTKLAIPGSSEMALNTALAISIIGFDLILISGEL